MRHSLFRNFNSWRLAIVVTAILGGIAIIGVSGRGDDETASREAGADAFLVKPVSPRALATALLEATRRAATAT